MGGSSTGILNAALIHLGEDPVTSLETETRTAARIAATRYPALRDALLRKYPWNFAVRQAALAADACEPLFGFSQACVLPSGPATDPLPYCLRLLRVHPAGRAKYSVQGRRLLTDRKPPVRIEYIARLENAGQYDPLFAELLAIHLAIAIGNRLGTSESRRRTGFLLEMKQVLDRDARRSDAMERSGDRLGGGAATGWIAARAFP